MLKRKLSKVEKIIIIAVVGFSAFIIGFAVFMQRTNKDIYLPANFQGWARIYYAVPNAKPLEKKNGAYQLHLDENGYLATSTALEDGTGRDTYFMEKNGKYEEIPHTQVIENERKRRIHRSEYHYVNFEKVANQLPINKDTLFYEQTRAAKTADGKLHYLQGLKSLELFYVSEKWESMLYSPSTFPDSLVYLTQLKRKLTSER